MEKPDHFLSKQEEASSDEFQEMLLNLPEEIGLVSGILYFYQGFWISERYIRPLASSLKHVAHDDDLILASCPKSGTTCLKSIAFSIVNRTRFTTKESPLLRASPHDLVPFLDMELYSSFQPMDLDNIPRSMLLLTHAPYASVPHSLRSSKCKIVYICRNPMHLFVSHWNFFPIVNNRTKKEGLPSIEKCFDMFCPGVHRFGPFWDRIPGFWNARLERPHKILYSTYEDLKEDTVFYIKQLAEFLGFPLSDEEEKQGVIEEIVQLCSLGKGEA